MSKIMKTLTINETTYEVIDSDARDSISALESNLNTTQSDVSAVEERVDALEQSGGSGLTQTEKNLILELFSKAAYAESDASTAYDTLENLWTTSTRTITYNLSYVSSSNTATSISGGSSYSTTLTATGERTINTVRVTMGGSDITSTAYSSGTITIPNVTGNIVITATAVTSVASITAVYTQSGTVYDTDSLDSLKADLVVTANYSGGTSETVSDYTLSGSLTVGTSTITVTYGGKTATFSVTVTSSRYTLYDYIYNSRTSGATSGDYVLTDLTYSPSFNTLNVEFEAMNSNSRSDADAIFCANNQDTSDTGNMVWYSRANKAGFSAYNLGVAAQLPSVPADTRAIIKYFFVDGGESYMQWGDTVVPVATMAKSSVSANDKPLVLAGGYSFSNGGLYGLGLNGVTKLGYVKFTDPSTNTLLYHFIPAYDNTASKWGFYEAVNHVFYPIHNTTLRCANWS